MRALTLVLATALVAGTPWLAGAASPVTGTIACTALGSMPFGSPYLPAELAEPLQKPLRVRLTTTSSTCSGGGVVGAKAPITAVDVRLLGTFGSDTSCADFLDTASLAAKVKVRWRGSKLNGSVFTVATSHATVASTIYDAGTDSFVVTTNPISKGAFAGSTLTAHFSLANVAAYTDGCLNGDYHYASFVFDDDNPITVDVP